jgi:hypothetical protein
MTGPEHYREAERLLTVGAGQRGSELDAICTAAAAVHATLALAAATALANYCGGRMTEGDSRRWFEAASAHPEHLKRQLELTLAKHAESAEEEPS